VALLAGRVRVGHPLGMSAQRAVDASPIPIAPVGDLDLDRDADEEAWERRVLELAAARICAARSRLELLGIVDEDGATVSNALPPDMASESDATLETG
jgi:hypothetical protein